MPRRLIVGALFCAALLALWPGRDDTASAQAVTKDQLVAALLTEAELPGFHQTVDSDVGINLSGSSNPHGIALQVRVVDGDRAGMHAALELIGSTTGQAIGGLDDADLGTVLQDFQRGVQAGANVPVANFQLGGSLGIGERDRAAVWNTYDLRLAQWATDYADVFVRGNVIGVVVAVGPMGVVSPADLITFAELQDAKVMATIPQ